MLIIGICGVVIHEINYYRAEKSYLQAADMIELPAVSETESETESEIEIEPETEPETETEIETETETEPETEIETEPETDNFAETLIETDLSSLNEVNEDVFGWITIPDTTVSDK